jgi:hypothetical protein
MGSLIMQVFSVLRTEYQLVRRTLLLVVLMFGLSAGMNSFAGSSPVRSSVKATENASSQDTVLDAKTLTMIQATTFEVVVKKPEIDSLKYEKALPLELIPYAFRNDKYLSVGTAFAIAPDLFVTAAHVLNLGAKSQMQGYSLRDKEGRVYPIENILKYSSRRDFTVFTIKGQITKQFLPVNTSPRLNEKVFAVGNAYGEGVVIRDGLHTSDTPEERDGAWKWIRFSAAASPGNSGGPLLDRDGKLIGIVQRKSENENLNFALPIAEVLNAKEHLAVVDNKVLYRIDNMPMTKITDYRHDIALPKSFEELNQELIRLSSKDDEDLMLAMFAENKKDIFPNGSGSLRLLHNSTYTSYFPSMVAMSNDGVWSAYKPENIDKATLGDNGYLATGMLGDSKYFHMRLPDNVALNDVVGDSKKLMDLFLKGANYTRTVSTQNIKIISMGKAQDEKDYVDSYQRKWSVKAWPIEFTDRMLVMMALPVPDGLVGYVRVVATGVSESNLLDMKALTDFTYVTYYGTLAQWRAYLSNKAILPAAFADIQISFEPGREFRYQSKRLSFRYPSSLMKITDISDLQLGFTFFRDAGKVVWDVSKIIVGEDKGNNVTFAVVRENNPPKSIGDEDLQYWEKLVGQQYPFNHSSYFDDGKTIIGTVISAGGRVQSSDKILYSVMHVADGVIQSDVAATRLDSFIRGMELREGAGRLADNRIGKSTSSKN